MNKKPKFAWASAAGVIRFSTRYHVTLLPVAPRWANSKHYIPAIKAWARLAYDNKTLLVPGLPENHGDYDALERFSERVARDVEGHENIDPTAAFSFAEEPHPEL